MDCTACKYTHDQHIYVYEFQDLNRIHLETFLVVLLAMNGSKAKLFMEMKTALYFLYNQILEYYPQELQIAQLIQMYPV